MGKKNKNKKTVQKPVKQIAAEQKVEAEQGSGTNSVQVSETKKVVKSSKPVKKPKKVKKESRLIRRLKETASELKKVSWPTFPKVLKQTGVVLAVVIFFGLILFGFDYLLKFLFELLVG